MSRTLKLFSLLPAPVWILPDDLLDALDAAIDLGKVVLIKRDDVTWAARVTGGDQ